MIYMWRVPNKKEPRNEALFRSVFATDLSLPVGLADLLMRTLCQDFHSVNRGFFMKLRFFAAGRWGAKKPRQQRCVARPVHRENNDANTQEEDTKHTSISITANHTGTKALSMYCFGRVTKFWGYLCRMRPFLSMAADRLMMSPRLYGTALLWLLSELFETLPEVGDPDKPKLVFFFDEAHLLFNDAPKALVEKVEQVARLIRSKGVGVYFVTQNPADVPDEILGQLGNRVQHALRAFTAKKQKDLRQAADTYRPNPNFDTAEAIREVGVGEAVVSFLEAKGAPSVVERCLIRPPSSKLGPMDEGERQAMVKSAPLQGKYYPPLDRESAYEILQARAAKAAAEAEAQEVAEAEAAREFTAARRYTAGGSPKRKAPSRGDSVGTAFAKSFARQMGTRAGRAVMRGVLGALTGR